MAAEGAWPLIAAHGLLSTSSLLDLFQISGGKRNRLELEHRPECEVIVHSDLGTAVVRDQKPMTDLGLQIALADGLTPIDWYRILNQRVFFWLTRSRLERMMNAKPYRNQGKTILEIDTAMLVQDYKDKIELSPMNTGATKPFPHPRGRDTFSRIELYLYESRRRKPDHDAIVELTVLGGVPNITKYICSVTAIDRAGSRRTII
jgi:hypothetical protein